MNWQLDQTKKTQRSLAGDRTQVFRLPVGRSNHWATKPRQELRANFCLSPSQTAWRVSHDVVTMETSAIGRLTWFIPLWYLWIWRNHVNAQCMSMYYPGQKKNHLRDSWREERCSTCDIMLDHAQSAQGKSRGQSRIRPCPVLIACDRAWYHTWNSVLLAANLKDGSFFFWPG